MGRLPSQDKEGWREWGRKKHQELQASIEHQQRLRDAAGLTAAGDACEAASKAEIDAEDRLYTTTPTTLAGAAALVRHVIEDQRTYHPDFFHEDEDLPRLPRLVISLERALSHLSAAA